MNRSVEYKSKTDYSYIFWFYMFMERNAYAGQDVVKEDNIEGALPKGEVRMGVQWLSCGILWLWY
jgi:hypothetical protein